MTANPISAMSALKPKEKSLAVLEPCAESQLVGTFVIIYFLYEMLENI